MHAHLHSTSRRLSLQHAHPHPYMPALQTAHCCLVESVLLVTSQMLRQTACSGTSFWEAFYVGLM